MRIKPRTSWNELYEKYGFPTRTARWCNNSYKMDAKKQLQEFMKSQGYYVVSYIGYCADEEKRFMKRMTPTNREVYPLVDFGINENEIWEWAKEQPIFNNYYKTNKRCGCMYCPMMSRISAAYLLKYYPENFNFAIEKMKETEAVREKKFCRKFSCISSNSKYNAEYLSNIIRTKWLKKLEEKEQTK